MNRAEKLLYHQIHPLKLTVDISSCVVSCALFWQQRIAPAMLISFIPAILASLLVTSWLPLERRKESALGRYVSGMMTPAVTAQRMVGQIIMWIAAYQHELLLLGLGALVIVLAWLSGLGQRSMPRM